jgi:hypothetical protein
MFSFDTFYQNFVLFWFPWAFVDSRIQNQCPAISALFGCPAREPFGNFYPVENVTSLNISFDTISQNFVLVWTKDRVVNSEAGVGEK